MSQPQQPGSTGPHGQPTPVDQYPGQHGPVGQQAQQYGTPAYGSGPQHGGTQHGGPQQYGAQQGSAPQYGAPQQYGAAQQYGSGQAYPPQGSAPQYGPSQPTPPAGKPKKPLLKRWWFWVLAVLALFIVIGIASGGGDESTTDTAEADPAADSQTSDEAAGAENAAAADDSEGDTADDAADDSVEDAPATYGLGDTVPTGDWEITVADVETGVSEVGDQYLNSTAQGQYILVDIEVTNTGSEPTFFFEDNVKLLDEAGNTYAADSEASLYTTESGDVFLLEEINPGNTASGVLVFDVPADASPNILEFQGGIFDTPAEVALD